MKMRNEQEWKLYNLPLPILNNLDKPFYQELVWLQHNKKFNSLIKKLRKERKIHVVKLPVSFEAGRIAKTVLENKPLIPVIRPIVERCKLGNGKYKTLMFEAIMSYLFYDSFITFGIRIMLDKLKKQLITPSFSLQIEPIDKRVTITVAFPLATKRPAVLSVIKDNWQKIEMYQTKYKNKRLSPKRDWPRDYKFYTDHIVNNKSYEQIRKSYLSRITKEGVILAINRTKKRINQSFN